MQLHLHKWHPSYSSSVILMANAKSLKNTTVSLSDHIATNNCDIMAISKTWLCCEATNGTVIKALVPNGYSFIHVDSNSDQRDGGVELLFREHLHLKLSETISSKKVEFMNCTMTIFNKTIIKIVFYRPLPSIYNQLSTTAFVDKWCDFITQHSLNKSEHIVWYANLHSAKFLSYLPS